MGEGSLPRGAWNLGPGGRGLSGRAGSEPSGRASRVRPEEGRVRPAEGRVRPAGRAESVQQRTGSGRPGEQSPSGRGQGPCGWLRTFPPVGLSLRPAGHAPSGRPSARLPASGERPIRPVLPLDQPRTLLPVDRAAAFRPAKNAPSGRAPPATSQGRSSRTTHRPSSRPTEPSLQPAGRPVPGSRSPAERNLFDLPSRLPPARPADLTVARRRRAPVARSAGLGSSSGRGAVMGRLVPPLHLCTPL
ncbi:hypothetical protein FHS34_008371 [Streptomyces echinatus]|uniref:Uncharacterized protein n=1 Tax=Streptomyces echinatus TaxID=67293 RepID=A0A7W9UVJ1_9ACTN|nr:hypothetical protein [Streptomyces echinatus]